MLPLEATLESVTLINLGQILGELYRRVEFLRNQKRVAAEGAESIEAKRGQATVQRHLGNILNPELFRDPQSGAVRLQASSTDTVETDTRLIDQSR